MKLRRLLTCSVFLLTMSFSIAQETSLDKKKYILIGDIEQWITIKGKNRSNPVILIVHGGPGSPTSPFSEAIFGEWETDFTLVNWDQRGAGRTFGRNSTKEVDEDYWIENPLTVEQMTADGIEVSQYLRKYLDTEKIILLGSSWGSVLATKMALMRPDLYYAYIGHSQLVNPSKDIVQVYQKIHQLAHQHDDAESIDLLKSLGLPPYQSAQHMGQLLRIIKKYERENSLAAPESWWKISSEYDNETDELDRHNGDDYSFIHYVGHVPLGIKGMYTNVDFMKENLEFEIPVYLIQGEEDLLTPLNITTEYFRKIKAPEKKLLVVPEAAHGFNRPIIDTHNKLLLEKIRPLIQNGHKE